MKLTAHPIALTAPAQVAHAETLTAQPARAVLRSAVGCGACLVASRVFAEVAVAGWPTGPAARPDDIVLALLAWAGMLIALWLALAMALTALGQVPGVVGTACSVIARRVTPRLVRQALGMALGASVGTLALPTAAVAGPLQPAPPAASSTPLPDPGYHSTTASPAPSVGDGHTPDPGARFSPVAAPPTPITTTPVTTASPTPTPMTTAPPTRTSDALPEPGWRPTRPAPVLDPHRATLLAPTPRLQTATVEHVTVRRGDTLWSIAARHLGPQATDAEIAREWPRWYTANADAVGPDPDSIQPGTQLVAPEVLAR